MVIAPGCAWSISLDSQRGVVKTQEMGAGLLGGSRSFPVGVMIFLGLGVGYVALGMLGLVAQSPQVGVSPVWPASGLAFVVAYRFGIPYLLAVVPAMLVLGRYAGVPAPEVMIAALGAVLEAAVPLLLLGKLGFREFRDMRSILLFIAIAAVLGPVFSASLGVLAMMLGDSLVLSPVRLWLLWWLGNSVGLFIFGGLGMAALADSRYLRRKDLLFDAAILHFPVVVLVWYSLSLGGSFEGIMLLYLLIPMMVVLALRQGLLAVFLGMTMALLGQFIFVLQAAVDGASSVLYQQITLVWMITLAGALVAAARNERVQGEQYVWLATHDSLTQLLNRHEFVERLQRAARRVCDGRGEYVLLQIDLDHFKEVNDQMGHAAGDALLRDVAKVLVGEVRGRDTVARLGGDEFVILLDSCALHDAAGIAENIRRRLQHFSGSEAVSGTPGISASIGVVKVRRADKDAAAALSRADQACYAAKHAGRNHIALVDESV